eukprot:176774_1
MELSLQITWIYFGIYCSLFLITSIWSAIIVKEEYKNDKSSNDDIELQSKTQESSDKPTENTTNKIKAKTDGKKGCKHYFKKWIKLSWAKKKIYVSIAPHLFDQATDLGVIAQYYQYTFDDTSDIDKDIINPLYWFYLSIIILIIHRFVSSLAIYLLTHNWFNVCLQMMDVLMVRSVWTSYKLKRNEPSTTQRYLGILEATFEAMPQLLLSAVWITKTGKFDIIIIVSFISSLISLTARVASDDKLLFSVKWHSLDFSYKSCPIINWRYIMRIFMRFMEISSRLALLTLMWINLGGMATGIIIGFEMLWLMIICVGIGTVGNMGNLMYLIYDKGTEDTFSIKKLDWQDGGYGSLWAGFIVYRLVFSYIYLILVTCFANIRFESIKIDDYDNRHSNTMDSDSIGLYLFVYVWSAFFLWPCCGVVIGWVLGGLKSDNISNQSTGRSFNNLYCQQDYEGIIELCAFGKKLNKQDLEILKKLSKGETNKSSAADIPLIVQEQAAEFLKL